MWAPPPGQVCIIDVKPSDLFRVSGHTSLDDGRVTVAFAPSRKLFAGADTYAYTFVQRAVPHSRAAA